jgi:hypothetical protein
MNKRTCVFSGGILHYLILNEQPQPTTTKEKQMTSKTNSEIEAEAIVEFLLHSQANTDMFDPLMIRAAARPINKDEFMEMVRDWQANRKRYKKLVEEAPARSLEAAANLPVAARQAYVDGGRTALMRYMVEKQVQK